MDGSFSSMLDSKKVSRGVVWVLASIGVSGVVHLITAAALTYYLDPSHFGLMALIYSLVIMALSVTNFNMEMALIQKEKDTDSYIDAAWTSELIRHLFLFALLFLCAPWIAQFFDAPNSTNLIRVALLGLVFRGFTNMSVFYFRKNLEFSKQFVFDVVPHVFSSTMTLILAMVLRNVWALVLGYICSMFAVFLLSYVLHPRRPRLVFSREKVASLFSYSLWITFIALLVMVRQHGLNLLTGKILGTKALGFYNRADTFSASLHNQVIQLGWKVVFPAFSKIQNTGEYLRYAFLKMMRLTLFFALPIAGFGIVFGPELVSIFLQPKWYPVGILVQIISMQAIFTFINTPANILFYAVGKPKITAFASIIGVTVFLVLLYPFSQMWGIEGVAYALLMSHMVQSPYVWLRVIQVSGASAKNYIFTVFTGVLRISVALLVIIYSKRWVDEYTLLGIGILMVVGAITYFLFEWIWERFSKENVFQEAIAAVRTVY